MALKFSNIASTSVTNVHQIPFQYFGYQGSDKGQAYGGDASNNYAYGNGGNDIMFGNDGNDHLFGGSGNDSLLGGNGNDTLTGGTGKDMLYGGAGADTFVFKIGDSGTTTATADVVVGVDMWDRIDVSSAVANGENNVVQNTSVTSIDQATALCNMMAQMNGPSDTHAVLFANASTNTSYLVMDMDANGTFETGVVIEGMGNPSDAVLDWMLV